MILYRYIIKEHIFPFLASLSIIVFYFIMQQAVMLLERIVSKGLDPKVVLEVFIIQLGWIIALAIPMAILTATLWVFGRMSGDNEITSIKASGQSMLPLLFPVLAAASVFTVFLVFFNDLILPDANHRTANLLSDISRKRPAAFIEPKILIRDFPGYTIYTEDVNPRSGELKGIRIFCDQPGQDPSSTVASHGIIRMTPDQGFLELTLFNGETHSISRKNWNDYFLCRFMRQVVYIQNIDTKLERTNSSYRSDREMSSAAMLDEVAKIKADDKSSLAGYRRELDTLTMQVRLLDSLKNNIHDPAVHAFPAPATFAEWAASLPSRTPPSPASTEPAAASHPVPPGKLIAPRTVGRVGALAQPVRTPTLFPSARSGLAHRSPFKCPLPGNPVPHGPVVKRPPTAPPAGTGTRYEAPLNKIRQLQETTESVIRRIHANQSVISQFMVEVHKKFAIPMACLIFVIIGAPLGIMARRGGLTVGASYSIFFFIAYWAFLIEGEDLGDKMAVPPWVAMWGGNIVIALCGIILLVLMMRESTIRIDGLLVFFKKTFGGKSPFLKSVGSSRAGRLPSIVFKGPKWLLKRSIGTLPMYLVWLFVGYVVGVLLALIAIFVVIDYVSNLGRFEKANFAEVGLFYWYYLPWIIQISFPIVLLLAALFSMGKLAKSSELIAMKAAGVSIRRLTMPLLFLGVLLSIGTFYGGEWIIPKANFLRKELADSFSEPRNSPERHHRTRDAKSLIKEFRRNFYYFGNKSTMYMFQEFSTLPQTARGIWRESFDSSAIRQRIQADHMLYDSTGWRFIRGTVRTFTTDSSTVTTFDTLRDTVLRATPIDMVAQIKSPEEMSYWELDSYIEAAARRGEAVQKFQGQLEFKKALPWMNFIVILLGISITARAGRKGSAALFGIGLMMTFVYWLISQFAIVFAQNGHLPVMVGAWIGNAIFFILGLFLFRKASQ
jgi:lipopolysaccharide export system permease protein